MGLRRYCQPDARRDLAQRILTLCGEIQASKCAWVRDARTILQLAHSPDVAGHLTVDEILEVEDFGASMNLLIDCINKGKWPR